MNQLVKSDADSARSHLMQAINDAQGQHSLKSLSLALGKNPAYLHQYVNKKSPRSLPEDLRFQLAKILSVNEQLLRPHSAEFTGAHHNLAIPFLDHPSQQKHCNSPWFIPQRFFEGHCASSSEHVKLAVVDDPSSEFTAGDTVMIDISDQDPLMSGYFALDMGKHLRIRHLEQPSPYGELLKVSNPENTGYETLIDQQSIIGRVIFHAKTFTPRVMT